MRSGRRANSQRGVLIIWLALFLLFLIGFVSVGIDLAKLAATQAQLQTAADAAALAGATAADSLTGLLIHPTAIARAQFTGSQNKAYEMVPTSVTIEAADIWFPNDTTIHVVAKRVGDTGMVTHFAAALLGPLFHKLDMKASAEAVVVRPNAVCGHLFPMGAVQPPAGDFQPGCIHKYALKVDTGTQGNYGLIDYPDCDKGPCAGMNGTGGATLRCLAENGYWCCISELQWVDCEPGNKTGPVRAGLQARWDADSDQRSGICYEDYTGNGNRVVTVPLTGPFPNGRGRVQVLGFANFFLLNRPGGGLNESVDAEFILKVQPGSGGGGNGSVLAIHLVK